MDMAAWLIALVLALALGWLLLLRGRWARALSPLIERRLGGYRQQAHPVDDGLPLRTDGPGPRVAVIGGGLAGIGAATALSERGVAVTLFERNPYLGGKIGAWPVVIDGAPHTIEHGFHAFFRQYYNLNRFLDRLGLRSSFRPIEDYLILDGEGRELSFAKVETVPALNIVDLGKRGFFRWRDAAAKRTRDRLQAFVRFDMERTYEAYDPIPFGRFCDEAALPPELRVSFRTFARAFFADEVDLSTADVLRAFHFYYLSHDHGLLYDYPQGDYETTLLAPIRAHLTAHGVALRLGAPVAAIERGKERRFAIQGEEYDWVVMAADIAGMQAMVAGSKWLQDEHPELVASLRALRTSHGYAVWRLWVDRDVRPGLPTFINVEKRRVLDSVTLYHRITDEAATWVREHGGAVLELHSYALPQDLHDEAELRRVFLEELAHYFPELQGLSIAQEVLQVRHDFPAFAPGQRAHRPKPKLPVEGLLVAGDWVRLPYPMTHMEAAFTSGLVCANVVFDSLGLRPEPIFTVAPKGLLRARRRRLKDESA
jgi:isorenieratene synthase